MLLLAIDTTGRSGGVALARDGSIVEAVKREAPKGFASIIYQEIEALLARNGVKLGQIDCYAAAAGPGSFTGIRVGLSVVKALAEVHGKKVVPVSNLKALAFAGAGKYRAPVMDARRGEVYAAVYDEQLRPVVEEVATRWEDFLALVGGRPVSFVALDGELFRPGGAAALDAGRKKRCITLSKPLATAVARLACRVYEEGGAVAPEAVDANYIRRSDAELNWREPE